MKIFLSAGEASGEHYGTLLIPALRRILPETEFFGLGGQRMEALGFRRIVRAEDVAVMGITEVIRHMPHIYREYHKLRASIAEERPDAAILIDFPDVNLSLARHLKQLGIPVIYFVSPQLWAWKKYRIRKVQRFVDRMLVIFPFEEEFYRHHGVQADFVGHPLADLPLPTISRVEFARENGLDPSKLWIGLLPGSRGKEIRLNLPEILKAASELKEDCEFVLPLAPTLTQSQRGQVREMLTSWSGLRITLVENARATLHHAQASIVASGTATVEAALIGNPFIVVYRISPLSYTVAKCVVDVPYVAMVNLIAGKLIVPELIQGDFTAANVVSHLQPLLLDVQARARMQNDLRSVGTSLKIEAGNETAIDRVADIAAQMIHERLI